MTKGPTKSSLEQYIEKFPKSRALYERGKRVFRDGITHDARLVSPFPIYITKGKGSHKWDVDGYEYIDYFGGHGALILGHAHPSLVKAVSEQITKGTQWAACHELEIEWAELIQQLMPSAEMVEFTNSGTEANMMAVRLARAFTGRGKIIKFRGQMGGSYDTYMVGDKEPWNKPTSAGIPQEIANFTVAVPINDEKALAEALSKKDAAMLTCEPWGAYSGVFGIAPTFYRKMRDLTARYGTLLHFDEVVSGFRYSPGGVQGAKGIRPDLTTLGKNLTGGLPGAGAVVGRKDILDLLRSKDIEWNNTKRVPHAGTFNGNPLCAAAGIATLKILATGEPQKVAIRLACLYRDGLERVFKERGINGCAYSDGGSTHIFFGGCGLREHCDRGACLNSAKVRPVKVGQALYINLALNGVLGAARAVDCFLSAAHTEADIEKSVKAFDASITAMMSEGVLEDFRL
jgi:glutamate-1-semialdehyde 2,1-aminomutase